MYPYQRNINPARASITLSCLALLIVSSLTYSAVPEETIPPYHWMTESAIYLTDAGIFDLDLTFRPFTRGQIAHLVYEIGHNKEQQPRYAAELIERFKRELSAELIELAEDEESARETVDSWHWHAGGYTTNDLRYTRDEDVEFDVVGVSKLGVRIWPGLYIYNGIRFDSYLPEDKNYTGKYRLGFGGYPEQAYVALNYKRISGWIGSNWMRLGPGRRGSLMLSDASRPFKGINIKVDLSPFIYSWGAFELDAYSSEQLRRHLSVHRAEWRVTDRFEFALSEMLIYTGRHLSPQLHLYNPAAVWQLEKFAEVSGNVLLSADILWRLSSKITVGFEFLVDRIQLEIETPEDLEPSQFGSLLNVVWSDPLGIVGSRLSFENAIITPRTYKTSAIGERALHYGVPVGWQGDIDVIDWFLCWDYMPRGNLLVGLDVTFERKGKDYMKVALDTTYRNNTVEEGYDEPFPTGTVMSTLTPGISVSYHKRDWLEFRFRIEHYSIVNENHKSDVSRDGWAVKLGSVINVNVIRSVDRVN